MTSPDGTAARAFTGYGFDHSYELVAGKWRIELWYEKQKLAGQDYDVIAASK